MARVRVETRGVLKGVVVRRRMVAETAEAMLDTKARASLAAQVSTCNKSSHRYSIEYLYIKCSAKLVVQQY